MARRWLRALGDKLDLSGHHHGLSAARFTFFMVAFCDWLQLYFNRGISFVPGDEAGPRLLLIELGVMLLLAVGFQTRVMAILNLALLQLLDRDHMLDHYHLDYAVYNYAFIFLVAPSPRVWSVDSYLDARRGRPRSLDPVPAWFTLLFFLGLELVYFDSLFYKRLQVVWMQGLAFWMPAALPHFSAGRFPEWAELGWLVKGASYFAFAVETLFPLALFARLRRPVALAALGLHLGIAVFFPIPFFGLGVCALLLYLLLPQPTGAPQPAEPPQPSPARRIGAALGWALCAVMTLGQVALILIIHFAHLPISRPFASLMEPVNRLMGLYSHGVYVDEHFIVPAPLLRLETEVDGERVVIPCYDEPGYPERSGRYWVMTTFHLRWNLCQAKPGGILKRYVQGWFQRQGIAPRPVRVRYKRANYPLVLDFEIDDRIRAEPWREAGWLRPDDAGRLVADWAPRFEIERMGIPAALGEPITALEGRSDTRYALELGPPGAPPRLLASRPPDRRASIAIVASGSIIAERLVALTPAGAWPAANPTDPEAYRVVERSADELRLIKPERVGRLSLRPVSEGILRGGVQVYPVRRSALCAAERQGSRLVIRGPTPAGGELVAVFRKGALILASPTFGPRFEIAIDSPEPAASLEVYALTRQGLAGRYALSSN